MQNISFKTIIKSYGNMKKFNRFKKRILLNILTSKKN